MPRQPAFKVAFRPKNSRSSASSSSNRRGKTRRATASTSTSRRSSVHSASTTHAGLSRPRVQIYRGPFLDDTSTETPSEVNQQADENDDLLNEVIMAVDLTSRGTVGCCYYVAREEKLYFMEDMQFGNADVVDSCKYLFSWHAALLLTTISESIHRSYSHSGFEQDR